jgi:hypothetical protein
MRSKTKKKGMDVSRREILEPFIIILSSILYSIMPIFPSRRSPPLVSMIHRKNRLVPKRLQSAKLYDGWRISANQLRRRPNARNVSAKTNRAKRVMVTRLNSSLPEMPRFKGSRMPSKSASGGN